MGIACSTEKTSKSSQKLSGNTIGIDLLCLQHYQGEPFSPKRIALKRKCKPYKIPHQSLVEPTTEFAQGVQSIF